MLCALRTLGSGLKFKDAREISGYMSETTANNFFREFNKLFRLHFEDIYLNRFSGEDLQTSMLQFSMLGLPGCVRSIDATFIRAVGQLFCQFNRFMQWSQRFVNLNYLLAAF